jgi:hypothetical protein
MTAKAGKKGYLTLAQKRWMRWQASSNTSLAVA